MDFSEKRGQYLRKEGNDVQAKNFLPILGIGMVAGAALSMTLKPKDQAMIREKTGIAMKTVGDAMENIGNTIHNG